MKVSFIIPTYRKYEDFAKKTIESIKKSDFNFHYEILVCSKERIEEEGVIWIEEPPNNNGSVEPINICFKKCRGKYFALLNDDFNIDKSFKDAIDFLESSFYNNRKIKLTALQPQDWLDANELKFIPEYDNTPLPCEMLCFPVGETENIKLNIGENLLSPSFKHHWSDVWLTYYIYKKYKEIIPLCKTAIIKTRVYATNHHNSYEDKETYFFMAKQLTQSLM